MDWPTLHDAVLERLEFFWESGTTVFTVGYESGGIGYVALLTCRDTTRLECPRELPWGPSIWINKARRLPYKGATRLEIEMQSGDVIAVLCADCIFTSTVEDEAGPKPS